MKQATPIARTFIAAVIIGTSVLVLGELRPPLDLPRVAGQTPILLPGQTSLTDVDMTPAERSPEVQQLRKGSTFVPDPGEPAGAIKAYFATQDMMRKAGRRLEVGLLPGEIDFDPYQLLDEALAMRQRATVLYPTSRHAWQGLGELSWHLYIRQHRSADLRRTAESYTKVADLLMPRLQQGGAGPRPTISSLLFAWRRTDMLRSQIAPHWTPSMGSCAEAHSGRSLDSHSL